MTLIVNTTEEGGRARLLCWQDKFIHCAEKTTLEAVPIHDMLVDSVE